MERKNMKAVALMAMIMLGMVANASASFVICYGECYAFCVLDFSKQMPIVPKKFLPCAFKCLQKCLFKPNDTANDHFVYCNIGCAMDKCKHVLHDGAKMEKCVNSCSSDFCSIKS